MTEKEFQDSVIECGSTSFECRVYECSACVASGKSAPCVLHVIYEPEDMEPSDCPFNTHAKADWRHIS